MISEQSVVINCLPGVVKLSLRFRLFAMGLAVAALAAIIVGAAAITGQQVATLRWHISTVQLESFRIADKLQTAVLSLNATLLRFVLGHSPEDWQGFVSASDRLQRWLARQHPSTPREQQEIAEVRTHLAAYQAEAGTLAASDTTDHYDVLPVLSKIEKSSQKILSLGYALASAHRAATARLVDDSQRSLTLLQQVIFVALALLLVIGAWIIIIFYREMIAPLQLKLVETRAMTERQEKLASLGVLAAGVAHEIRNPLTAIKARLFTLNKAIGATPGAVEDANVIEREINRLERIVRAVLSFARPAEPKQQLVPAMALLRDVRDLMSAQLSKANIELIVEGSTDPTIQGDPDQLKQVLLNLVQNAADSIGECGKIVLWAAVERANLRGHFGNVAILEVKDNGKGISVEVQKRLFDPFYTTKPAGTGLGLSIAARIIERHGGASVTKPKLVTARLLAFYCR
jgi:signal transduction histidine kinase